MFAVFVIYPIVASLHLSLHNWRGIGPKTFVGLSNYRELLADTVFHEAALNNLCVLAVHMLAPVLGLAFALFLNQPLAGMRGVRALFFLPFVLSQIVIGLLFGWFFNTRFGLLNHILVWIGAAPVGMLDGERSAIFAVAVAGLWPQTAYCMILYLTGLMGLKRELIDAARLDGARGFRLLWHVVLPQLRPVTFIVAMVCVVSALRSFDLVMIMTGGGPYNSSNVLAYYMYEQTFLSLRYGYGATVAVALFVLMGTFVGFFLWQLLRRERP